jgi:orotate phosphoribosyltransferase
MTTPCEIAGIKFEHNVWNACVPTSFQELYEISKTCSGAVVIKTHTLNEKIGNPDEYYLYDWGCKNNIALHNFGIAYLTDHLSKTKYGKPLFISIYGTADELNDMIRCLNTCKPHDQLLIELNLSCPNAEEHKYGDLLLLQLQTLSDHPIGVKINVRQDIPEGSPAFITCINTAHGISGRCIQEFALKKIAKMKKKYPGIPIIGCGGAETLVDIRKFLDAGATAVEIGTGYLRWGSQVFMTKEQLLNNFVKRDGSWILSSGATSDIYIDFRKAPSHPFLWKQLVELVAEKINKLDFDYICGVPHGAVPLATALAQRLQMPLLMLRKKAKIHGTKQMIEGEYKHGKPVLLIEDVVTTGKSLNDAKKVLEENKLVVNDTFCLFNRSDREINSLFNFQDLNITSTDRLRKIIQQKRTRLVFAADISDPDKLLEILQGVAPHICMVKLHLDLINNIPPDFYDRILALSRKFNFLIMDDRKYVDIGAHWCCC